MKVTSSRVRLNVKKTINMLSDLNVGFEESDCVFNVLSKAVLPTKASTEMLNNFEIGRQLYKEFIEERITGATSLWSPMKKKLKNFSNSSKSDQM